MRVCLVSEATARHFKRGTRAPSPQAARLWSLHIEGRILGSEWERFKVHRGELVDADGLVYTVGEIATLPLLYSHIAELEKQLDKVRYLTDLGEIGFFEITENLSLLLQGGTKLLRAIEKIPRRSASRPRRLPERACANWAAVGLDNDDP